METPPSSDSTNKKHRPRVSDAAQRAIDDISLELEPYELTQRRRGEKPAWTKTHDLVLAAFGLIPEPASEEDRARVVNVKRIVARKLGEARQESERHPTVLPDAASVDRLESDRSAPFSESSAPRPSGPTPGEPKKRERTEA